MRYRRGCATREINYADGVHIEKAYRYELVTSYENSQLSRTSRTEHSTSVHQEESRLKLMDQRLQTQV